MVRGARKQGLLWQQECAAVTFHLLTSQWDRQQRGQEVAELETSRSTHPTLLTMSHLLKVLQPSQTLLPDWDQMFKHMNMWDTFNNQAI